MQGKELAIVLLLWLITDHFQGACYSKHIQTIQQM